MDNFYKNYKTDYQFFDLNDFTTYVGNTVAGIYQKMFDVRRQEFRQEKKDEVVTFDEGMLSEQIVTVKREGEVLIAELKEPIMSFLTDVNNSGIQSIFIVNPKGSHNEIERTSLSQLWQLQYIPKVNKMFFHGGKNKITIVNKSDCNVSEIKVYYIPQMYDCAYIPETIANEAIANTVLLMKQMHDKTVVKKSLDNNDNEILETEIDKEQTR